MTVFPSDLLDPNSLWNIVLLQWAVHYKKIMSHEKLRDYIHSF